MNIRHARRDDRIFRAAAWFYALPPLGIGLLMMSVLGLGVFLVLIQIALTILRHAGA